MLLFLLALLSLNMEEEKFGLSFEEEIQRVVGKYEEMKKIMRIIFLMLLNLRL